MGASVLVRSGRSRSLGPIHPVGEDIPGERIETVDIQAYRMITSLTALCCPCSRHSGMGLIIGISGLAITIRSIHERLRSG
jgi:hypothetical protein